MEDLTGARTSAQQATERVATLEQNAPEMLRNLKSNLTSIFSKDNPLIQQREQALSTFLAAPSAARASTLPANLPQVAGSNLNLSPTQLASVEQGRTAAAFAPLASLNNLIVGQYGNIGDILGGAASTYEAQVNAARTRAEGALSLYQQLVGEDQFNRNLALEQQKANASNAGIPGLNELIEMWKAQIAAQQGQDTTGDFWEETQEEPTQASPDVLAPVSNYLSQNQGLVGQGIRAGQQSGLFSNIGDYFNRVGQQGFGGALNLQLPKPKIGIGPFSF